MLAIKSSRLAIPNRTDPDRDPDVRVGGTVVGKRVSQVARRAIV